MPRAGWRKPESGERLSDHISISVLTRVYPPAVVDAAIAATGRSEQRRRLLPARVVMYGVMAMALFSEDSYEDVMRRVVDGLSWLTDWQSPCTVPTKAAISRARERLGVEPLIHLFRSVVRPLGGKGLRGAWYRGWRLMSIDCNTIEVADTPENQARFGKARLRQADVTSSLPQIRLATLAEHGTHAIVDVAMGPCDTVEPELLRQLLRSLRGDVLCMAQCNAFSQGLWQEAAKSDAELLWQVPPDLDLPVVRELPDGSYLSRLYHSEYERGSGHGASMVRVIDCRCPHGDVACRLFSTILDHDVAPAADLARLYCGRWKFDTTLGELKSVQAAPRLVLRSKTPEGVIQEMYGYLLTHYAIRALVHDSEVPEVLEAPAEIPSMSLLSSLGATAEPRCGGPQRLGCQGCPYGPQANVVIRQPGHSPAEQPGGGRGLLVPTE